MEKENPSRTPYWLLVEPVWLPLNHTWDDGPEEFTRQFRNVRPGVGHLYAAHWCQSEVCNGGFLQFFSNTTGLLAPEALEGFRAIGMTEWAETLSEAMDFFGSPYPRERGARVAVLPSRQSSRQDRRELFGQLDERFFKHTVRWDDAADAYAARIC